MAVIGLFSHMFRMCFRILHGIDYILMVCAKVMTSCVSKKIYILCKFRHREKTNSIIIMVEDRKSRN